MRILPFFFLWGMIVSWPIHADHEEKTLIIAADLWCPINCDPEAADPGIGVDLARKVFEPQGYRVHYITLPWARALDGVRHGTIDAVIGANQSDDPTLIYPRTPICEISDDFYVLRDNPWKFTGTPSLEGQRLGTIVDYGYDENIESFIKKQHQRQGFVQEVSGEDALTQNIRKLLAGRIDVLIESKPVMNYMLMSLGLEKKIRHAGGVPQGYVYLAFSPALPESKERARLYDVSIGKLQKEGVLAKIYTRYGIDP